MRLAAESADMPKVKRSRKPPPEGWELIEPTLDELDQKMREGESARPGARGCTVHRSPTTVVSSGGIAERQREMILG